MNIYIELMKFVQNVQEFTVCIQNIRPPFQCTYKEIFAILTEPNLQVNDDYLLKINVVLDYLHDELNTGHWCDVPISTRQAFTASTFIKAIIILKLNEENQEIFGEILKIIDLGLLLGAPLNKNTELLVNAAKCLTERINKTKKDTQIDISKKRKLSCTEINKNFETIAGKEINTISCPSVELFDKEYFQKQIPVKLTDCINHWPALTKWQNINYLLKVAGNRTIPVEIGSHYADENWSQKLMTLQDFIKNHFLNDSPSENLGYLAQHNLFDQITELRNDISIPDYCCLSTNYDEACEPDINAWFGPERTVSPLHFDPKNNLLTQVFGIKQIIIFAPNDSEYLYVHNDKLLFNTAQVNPLDADLDKFPLFPKACMYKCLLKPGEMLFLPEKWWHHVTALDKSFSVSFWWQ